MTELIGLGVCAAAIVTAALIVRSSLARSERQLREMLPQAVGAAVAKETGLRLEAVAQSLQRVSADGTRASDALVQTSRNLSVAIGTLDGDGTLTEWVRGFQETAQPVVQAASSVEQHYTTAERLLEATAKIAGDCEAQRQSVHQAFTDFSTAVRERWSKEQVTLLNISENLDTRLKSVSALTARLADRFEELQTSEQHTLTVARNLSESMQGLVARFADLENINSQTQKRHADIVHTQQAVQNELQRQVGSLVKAEGEARESGRQALAEVNAQMLALRKERQAAEQRQSELIEKQRELISTLSKSLPGLPSRVLQMTIAILLGLQVVLTIVLIVRFSR